MTRAPTYDWRCPKCDAVNAAGTGVCLTCAHDVTYQPPSLMQEMKTRGVPLWRRVAIVVLAVLGVPLLFVGMLLFLRMFFPFDGTGMMWSAGAALSGATLLRIALALDPDR